MYNDVLNDPKVQLLPKALRWSWVELLCLASKNGGTLPPIEEIAFAVRASVNDARSDLDALILAGLIDIRPDGKFEPHNWDGRQYVSDSSAERTRKYRQRKQMQRHGDVTVTPPDTDTEGKNNNKPSTVDRAREVEAQDFDLGLGGVVSQQAQRTTAAVLGIANAAPLVRLYEAWPGSRRARDPDAHFIASAAKLYANASEAVKAACQPAPLVEPLPAVKASPQLAAKLRGKR